MRAIQRPPHIIDMVYYSIHIDVWESTYRPVVTATVSVKSDLCDIIQDQLFGPVSNTIRQLEANFTYDYLREDSDG